MTKVLSESVSIWVFSKNRGTPKMFGLQWKTLLKWMIWGYHYFRKHSYIYTPTSMVDALIEASYRSKSVNLMSHVHVHHPSIRLIILLRFAP